MANVPSEYQPVNQPVPAPTPTPTSTPAAVVPPVVVPNQAPVAPQAPPTGMPSFPGGSQQASYRQTGNTDRTINLVVFALPIVLLIVGVFVIFIVFSILLGSN